MKDTSRPSPGKRKATLLLGQLGISVVFILAMVSVFDFERGVDVSIHWASLPLFLGTILGAYALRAMAYRVAFAPDHPPYLVLCGVTALGNFASSVLPFGMGHFSFLYFFKKYGGTNVGSSLGVIGIYNLLRTLLFGLLLILSVFFLDIRESLDFPLAWVLGAAAAGMTGVFVAVRLFGGRFGHGGVLGGLMGTLRQCTSIRSFVVLTLLSVLVIGFNLLRIHAAFAVFDTLLSWPAVVLLCCLLNLSAVVPLNGPGRFGTYEAVAATSLYLVGVDSNAAVALGLMIHILQHVGEGVFALAGYLFLRGWGAKAMEGEA